MAHLRTVMHLYKFSNVNINKISCLASESIWFSTPTTFNDPFEGTCHISPVEPDELHQAKIFGDAIAPIFLNEIVIQNIKKDSDAFEISSFMKLGVLSLAEDKKEPISTNNLMWSHYGDALQGYCIKFKRDAFISSINRLNKDIDKEPLRHFSITYTDTRPKRAKLTFPYREASFVLGSKSKSWEYEQEYRLISNASGALKYDPSSVEAIILGERMPHDQKTLITELIHRKYPKTNIQVCRKIRDSYNLEIVEYPAQGN